MTQEIAFTHSDGFWDLKDSMSCDLITNSTKLCGSFQEADMRLSELGTNSAKHDHGLHTPCAGSGTGWD
jgi:hypothetical protein